MAIPTGPASPPKPQAVAVIPVVTTDTQTQITASIASTATSEQPKKKTNSLPIASLVVGILGIGLGETYLGVAALVLGCIAYRQIRSNLDTYEGWVAVAMCPAVTGIILGLVVLVLTIVAIVLIFLWFSGKI